jgi:hypothetical protein
VLAAVAACTVFRDYWDYSILHKAEPAVWQVFLDGRGPAPAQYRMGVLRTAQFLAHLLHLQMRHTLALVDFCALGVAMLLLVSLLRRSVRWGRASLAEKCFAAAVLVGLVQYALVWLTWYQRPETLTIAALTLAMVWLSTFRLSGLSNGILLLLCAVAQGFVRADAGLALNLGFALVCLTASGNSMALPRWRQFAVSLVAAGASGAVQLFVMKVLYPHAGYGDTPVFQLLLNLKSPRGYLPFLLFLVPVFWLLWQIAKRRYSPSGAQMGLLAGAAIFAMLWFVVGRIEEVRIFMPFSLALVPMTVEAALQRLQTRSLQVR